MHNGIPKALFTHDNQTFLMQKIIQSTPTIPFIFKVSSIVTKILSLKVALFNEFSSINYNAGPLLKMAQESSLITAFPV